MRLTALTALLALALPLSAAAQTTGLLDMELSLARNHFPVVILEIESGAGPLDVAVFWSVNGLPVAEGPDFLQGEQLLALRHFPMAEASVVCATVVGGPRQPGGPSPGLLAEDCVLWLPGDGLLRSVEPEAVLLEGPDRPVAEPLDIRPRRLRLAGRR